MKETESLTEARPLVCVFCGEPWEPAVKNRCECGGMCSWGYEKGGSPLSYTVREDGAWIPNPPSRTE